MRWPWLISRSAARRFRRRCRSNAAQAAGIDTTASQGPRKKGLLATLFNTDEDEETDLAQPKHGAAASTASTSRAASFSLASIDPKPEQVRTAAVPIPTARPSRLAAVPAVMSNAVDAAPAPAATGRDEWAVAGLSEAPRPPAPVQAPPRAPMDHSDTTTGLMPWPVREADKDHVPLDMVLAYAAQPQRARDLVSAATPEPMGEEPIRAVTITPTKAAALRDGVTAVPKKNFVRAAATGPVMPAKPVVQVANPGMRYDDPWLRAMILTPSLSDSMTATLYGEPDFTELRSLMNKPTTSVAMSFANDPYPGISAEGFSGEAVVFLNTYAFPQRTAWLQ